MPKRNKISLLGQSYVADLLASISEKPKMFKDLSPVCPNERTRSKKLKELVEEGLVTTVALKVERRHFVHYKLTEKGKKLVRALSAIKDIIRE